MIFQTAGSLVDKTAQEGPGAQSEEYVAEVLNVIGQVLIFNGITKFTSSWFDGRERVMATALIILFSLLGNYTVDWITLVYFKNQPIVGEGLLGQSDDNPTTLYDVIDSFKLVEFIMNLVLTLLIFWLFKSQPDGLYPTKSQQYYRSKIYEPQADVKYLIKYKEFRIYAVILSFLLALIDVVPEIEFNFAFVEAQTSDGVVAIVTIWGPVLFAASLLASAIVLMCFSQTNAAYKRYLLLLLFALTASLAFSIVAFASTSASFYGLAMAVQMIVMGALKLVVYEFITEISFPVSPCYALGILHAFSGLLTMIVSMLGMDIINADPLNTSYVFEVMIVALVVCVWAFFVFLRQPYKLNRTDFDFDRRATMVASYGGSKKAL